MSITPSQGVTSRDERKFNRAWKTRTGSIYPSDSIIHLNRREQTMIFRLRTGHCRLGAHFYKLKVVTTPQCHWNTEHQTLENVLQRCPTYDSISKNIWSQPKTMEEKLWGERDDLLLTGVCGGSKPHDLNSRNIKKLNAEEE